MLSAIDRYLGDFVDITGEGSGTHIVIWPRCKTPESVLVERAATLGVSIYGTSPYFLESNPKVGIVLGYARLREQEIDEGIRLLQRVLRD